ncbi:MAG: zinc-binding dehydrogenase [Candidatus Binataceae bacterium]
MTDLGADLAIDASKSGWVDQVMAATEKRGVEVIVDNVGGTMLADNIRALAIKGRLVSVGRNGGNVGECDLDRVAFKRASIIGVTFRTRTPQESLLCGERFAADCLEAVRGRLSRGVSQRRAPADTRSHFSIRENRGRARLHAEQRASWKDSSYDRLTQ